MLRTSSRSPPSVPSAAVLRSAFDTQRNARVPQQFIGKRSRTLGPPGTWGAGPVTLTRYRHRSKIACHAKGGSDEVHSVRRNACGLCDVCVRRGGRLGRVGSVQESELRHAHKERNGLPREVGAGQERRDCCRHYQCRNGHRCVRRLCRSAAGDRPARQRRRHRRRLSRIPARRCVSRTQLLLRKGEQLRLLRRWCDLDRQARKRTALGLAQVE